MTDQPSTDDPAQIGPLVEHLFRREYGKLVAVLSAAFGLRNLELAEDLVQDTLVAALHHWANRGAPDNPEAWLMQVAKNKALNLLKQRRTQARIHPEFLAESQTETAPEQAFLRADVEDSFLRLIFACCNAPIAAEDQVALVLKTACGLGVGEIARALLVSEASIAKRLYRAKQQLQRHAASREAAPLEVPGGSALDGMLPPVCTCLYLMFNEGYYAAGGDELMRKDLCQEAIRLCLLLTRRFPEQSEIDALLAMMLLHAARFDGRIDSLGEMVPFRDQDRDSWDAELIGRGLYYLTRSARGEQLSSYHVEASIAAQYCLAESYETTNWPFIQQLYHDLYRLRPSPVIRLNLAILSLEVDGPVTALASLQELRALPELARYSLLHIAIAQVCEQQGDQAAAAAAYRAAADASRSAKERAFIARRQAALRQAALS